MNLFTRMRSSLVWPMLWKEFIQMRRDRLTLGMMVLIPAIQLMLFGFAIRTEVRNLPTVVVDEANTAQSRALAQRLFNTGNLKLAGTAPDRAAAAFAIERGSARAALLIPPTFTADLKRQRTATAQLLIDAADPMASSAAISSAVIASQVGADAGGSRAVAVRPLDVRVRPLYNPALRSPIYIVPGIIGILLTLTMQMITSMAIVRERERGTLEQLVVTPIPRIGLMLGKIIPFAIVGYVQMSVVLLLGHFVFDVPLRGSLLLLYGVTAFFIIASLGLGLFVSTLVRTQVQAMQMSFFFIMPTILLSGFMFPRDAMPEFAKWLGAAFPITYFLEVVRGILLKGAGFAAIWPEVLTLALFAVALISLSAVRFQKSVE
ncbi:MAG TPA: ABC transporter permease [Gemmatimonadaceae bacterium]|nr:ABC transporter permease [Gemmatimonadaceae bacterium]